MLSDLRLYFVSVLQNISISVTPNEIIYISVSISVSVNEYNTDAYSLEESLMTLVGFLLSRTQVGTWLVRHRAYVTMCFNHLMVFIIVLSLNSTRLNNRQRFICHSLLSNLEAVEYSSIFSHSECCKLRLYMKVV